MDLTRPSSFHLQWHITERCNLNCSHCYQDPEFVSKELEFKDLKEILENFVYQLKKWNIPKPAVKVSVTGGEPMIREDFFDFLKELNYRGDFLTYGLLTNGTFLDKKKVSKLEDLNVDYVQVSLEGMEEINDRIRGKGTFKQIENAVDLLKDSNIGFTNISMTVNQMNFSDVPLMIEFAEKKGIHLAIKRLVPHGMGEKMKDNILTIPQSKKVFDYGHRKGVFFGCEDGILSNQFPSYRPHRCSAGYMSFTVMPNGDVYPCRKLPILCGNLMQESFFDIYHSDKMKEIRDLNKMNDVCHQCPNEKCLRGSRCLAYGYFGDETAPDPHCQRLFQKLPDPDLKWKNSSDNRERKLNQRWIKK